LKDTGVPTTGDGVEHSETTITNEVFPGFCSSWCLGAAGGGANCAGFEMKLWDNNYRCRAMTSALLETCTSFTSNDDYSHYSASYMYYQEPATNAGRCTHKSS